MSGGIVNFHRVVDVFDGSKDSWCSWHKDGAILAEYLPKDSPFQCYVSRIGGEENVDPGSFMPEPGDTFYLREVPEEAGTWYLIIASIVIAAAGYLVNRLVAPKIPGSDFGSPDGPTQSFGGIQTISSGGIPLPLCYGEVRTGGNIVDSFESAVNDTDFLDETAEITAGTRSLAIEKLPLENRLARSVSVLNTRVVLCSGPIEGISGIEINERSISEFPGLTVTQLLGDQHQPSIPDFDRTVSTVTYRLPVLNGTPVSVTMTNDADQLEVVLRFATGIYRVDDTGFKFLRKVEILVEYRLEGATAWITAGGSGAFIVEDFATNALEYRVRIAPLDRAVYELRVTRVTADETSDKAFSAFDLFFVNAITFQERHHPGVAQLAFSQMPGDSTSPINPTNYTSVVKGLNDIRTYTSETEFTTGWTDNPAWCCGNFLTSKHNGMGVVFDWNDINIPSFILWAAHCDRLVDDGRGALEKRATFNKIYDQRTSAFSILQDLASGTGVAIIYKGAKFGVVIDEPRPRTQIFSEANVYKGKIQRAYFPKSELPTRISVQFRNSELNWELDTTTQEDPDAALGLFQHSKTFRMLHITRPGQAAREAMRVVRTNSIITQAVELSAGVQAASLNVGDRIGISSIGIGVGLGSGQITHVASDDRTMHLDDEITFESGKTYAITVQHVYDGIIDTVGVVHPGTGVKTNIVVSNEFSWSRTLQAGDKYAIGEVDTQVRDYRVDDIQMAGLGEKFSVKIRAGLYDEDVFDLTPVSNPFITANELPHRDSVPGSIRNLKVVFSRAEPSSRVGRRAVGTIEVDWNPPVSFSIDHYEIVFREVLLSTDNSAWQIAGTTRGRHFQIVDGIAANSSYQVAVMAVSPGGLRIKLDSATKVLVATF